MSKIKHVLGISGGKDSAALAIYLNNKYPQFDFTYYFCDTGKELDETTALVKRLEDKLGKKVHYLVSEEAERAQTNPFDFFYKSFRGYLPDSQARWCTKYMKLMPFEKFVGNDPVVSYVGIRGDEEREGYISDKPNIQSIFPFRRNIWSQDVINKVLANDRIEHVSDLYGRWTNGRTLDRAMALLQEPIELIDRDREGNKKRIKDKLNRLLDVAVIPFNRMVFDFIQDTDYPLALESDYPLLENEDVLIRKDIFQILEDSDVGVPEYYKKIEYTVGDQKGTYARSRSGCYFCFFQQKIEWVWLYEQHPDLFAKAMEYENEDEGFTWIQRESLADLIRPGRIKQIKREHLNRTGKEKSDQSPFLLDILENTEDVGCAACFI